MPSIRWNPDVKLIISDVDETIADVYLPADHEIVNEISSLLTEGKVLFLITGASFKRVQQRITNFINPRLRKKILVCHCLGAEVWGFKDNGEPNKKPFYSLYDKLLSDKQKSLWRILVKKIIKKFNLKVYEVKPIDIFIKESKGNPLSVMLEDRGPQITIEFVNAYDLSPEKINLLKLRSSIKTNIFDFRIPILEYASKLFIENDIPISPRLGGIFALDFALEGASKKNAIDFVIHSDKVLNELGISKEMFINPKNIEIWGDKFSFRTGGYDFHMSEAVSPEVRSIDFRDEDPKGFKEGYNIILWNGKKKLHKGLLEYLKSRKKM